MVGLSSRQAQDILREHGGWFPQNQVVHGQVVKRIAPIWYLMEHFPAIVGMKARVTDEISFCRDIKHDLEPHSEACGATLFNDILSKNGRFALEQTPHCGASDRSIKVHRQIRNI